MNCYDVILGGSIWRSGMMYFPILLELEPSSINCWPSMGNILAKALSSCSLCGRVRLEVVNPAVEWSIAVQCLMLLGKPCFFLQMGVVQRYFFGP